MKYILYLDLDYTLVSASIINEIDMDVLTELIYMNYTSKKHGKLLKCEDGLYRCYTKFGDDHHILFRVRYYVFELLEKLSKYADIYIFTMGVQSYADTILDILDKNGIIKGRYYRHHCDEDGVKDMEKYIFNKERTILIDDREISFSKQPDNGLLIRPFTSELDMDLLVWSNILEEGMKKEMDARKIIYSYSINETSRY